jgi:outer membrane protein OmpA-like peptidoglycan-associated protein
MSINLLDLFNTQVTGQLASQASNFLGESENEIQSALGGLVPTILSSLIHKTSETGGINSIMEMINKLDLGALSNLHNLFDGGKSTVNGLMNNGNGIVESLLGNKSSGVSELIAKLSGLKNDSSSSLLKMAAPLLMGLIGNQVSGKSGDYLSDLLMEQKDYVTQALPAGIGSLLGYTNLFVDSSNSVNTTLKSAVDQKMETQPSARESNSLLKWFLPILVGAGLIFYITKDGCNKTVEETITSTEDYADDAAESIKDVVVNTTEGLDENLKSAFAQVDESAKTFFEGLSIEVGSAADQIKTYILEDFTGNPRFTIKNVNFASGSAQLSPEGQTEVDNLAALMKAYPAIKIDIYGHTDNAGDADSNLKLSEARAIAIMMRLVGKGNIDQSRLTAKGLGQTEPIADNNTEEGRAQNRRIELKVRK